VKEGREKEDRESGRKNKRKWTQVDIINMANVGLPVLVIPRSCVMVRILV
jgi:hypothetical protein